MDKALFDTIWQQAQAAQRPTLLPIPNEQLHVQRLALPDGSYETLEVQPARRGHQAQDIATLVALVADQERPSIWYCRDGVTAFFDDSTRRDQATFTLQTSPELSKLQELAAQRVYYKQRDFITLLRVTFHDSLGAYASLLPTVRKVKFKLAATGDSEIQVGRSSVGKQLMAELCGYEQLPEEVTLEVSVFEGEPVAYSVRCALDVNPEQEVFCLIPLPNSIEYAYQAGENWLEQTLLQFDAVTNKPIPLYRGNP